MAKDKTPQIDPEREYIVTLSRPVTIGSAVIRPSHDEIRLKGKVIASLGDAVIEFKEA